MKLPPTAIAAAVAGLFVVFFAVHKSGGDLTTGGIRRNLELKGCERMPTDAYFHITNRATNLLLPNSLGKNIYQSYSHDSWRFEDSGGDFYHLVGEDSGLALSTAVNGFAVVQEPSSFDIKREDWCMIARPGGFYRIKNRKSGLSLDATVNWGEKSAAEKVTQWWFYGGINQEWRIEIDRIHGVTPKDPPPNECAAFPPNTFYHIVAKQSGMALAVAGSSKVTGADVVQMPVATPGTAHSWRFLSTSGGFHQLFAQHSGLTLQPKPYGSRDLVQRPADPGIIDDWCFAPAGDGNYRIQNRHSNLVVDVDGYSTLAGSKVHSWEFFNAANQLWKIKTVSGLAAPPVAPPVAPPPPKSDIAISEWKGPFGTPVVAASAANLPDGKILMWSAYMSDVYDYAKGETMTAIFDPVDESFTEKLVSNTKHDMFCPGTSTLADGRIMVTGGADAAKVSFYNPQSDTWSIGPVMNIPRGYHTNTVLADGSVFLLGGAWNGVVGVDRAGEVWSPKTNKWRLLTGVPVSPDFLTADLGGVYRSDNHAWFFLAPNGRVFHAGPSKQMHWITTTGLGSFTKSVVRGTQDRMNGNAQLYDIGKILVVGGAANYDTGLGTKQAFIIDINGAEAVVTPAGNMAYARTLSNSVVLPSGEVVVIGGQTDTLLFSDDNAVYAAEIFDPVTKTFKTFGSMKVARNYHATALLMKDGRVMAAGGGLCGGCPGNHRDLEIFTPPYLIGKDGALATRSIITSYTKSARPGGQLKVVTNRNLPHTFALVRTSAVTHAVNTDQRRIPVDATRSGKTFTLTLPTNPNVCLVGVWYLFAMDAAGVPSVGVDVNILL